MNKKKAGAPNHLRALTLGRQYCGGSFRWDSCRAFVDWLVAVAWVVGLFGAVFLYRAVTWQVAVDGFEAGSIGVSWLIAAGGAVLVARTPAEAVVLACAAAVGGLFVGLGLIDQS
jgi:hypothetical protein